jgi:16S rRNA (cytosine967-C5)-methyltransferase
MLAIRFSHPTWVIAALRSALELDGKKDQLEALLDANNETPTVNLAALPNTKAAEYLTGEGLQPGEAAPTAFIATGNPEPYLSVPGVRVQDQGSQLVALALLAVAEKSGRWLDMCAGPGGKAALLQAGIAGDGGVLDCLEPIPNRADLVRAALNPNLPGTVKVGYGQDAKKNTYDAVLLDAPCTGLGSVRRKPESRWRKTTEQLTELTKLQGELLGAAADTLKSGGYLLYSTCSPLILETNTQIKQTLDNHPELELVNANEVLNQISPQLQMGTDRKTAQLWTHLHATDAMFIAILRKK